MALSRSVAEPEAIYGTRPWRVYVEGPTKAVEGSFHDTDSQRYAAEDFRSTTKGDALYAIELRWPVNNEAIIHSSAGAVVGEQEVESVELIRTERRLPFHQLQDGLHIRIPEHAPGNYAFVYRIHFAVNR